MVRLAAAAVVILLAAGAWLFFRPVMDGRIVIGELAAVAGQPSLQPGAGGIPLPGRVSTPIHFGDRLETGDADKAEIIFRDGTTLRLGFNTAVELPNPKSEIRNPPSLALPKSDCSAVRCGRRSRNPQTRFRTRYARTPPRRWRGGRSLG